MCIPRRLAGNVGYLGLRSFPPVEVAREAIAAALAVLQNTDALTLTLEKRAERAICPIPRDIVL